jgi:hypothetical protein
MILSITQFYFVMANALLNENFAKIISVNKRYIPNLTSQIYTLFLIYR